MKIPFLYCSQYHDKNNLCFVYCGIIVTGCLSHNKLHFVHVSTTNMKYKFQMKKAFGEDWPSFTFKFASTSLYFRE